MPAAAGVIIYSIFRIEDDNTAGVKQLNTIIFVCFYSSGVKYSSLILN